MLKTYISLTKPGIIRGNAITALAGFFLASKGNIDVSVLAAMIVGLSLIIASACVVNNCLDRDIDRKMKRTSKRALVSGSVSLRRAVIFSLVLGVLGSAYLGIFTNLLALGAALFGYFAYVVVYSVGKRRSVYGTVLGSISGAVPPVVGYLSVTNRIDSATIILFLILILWQMPHFYAIALYRCKDYAAANIPVLPLVKGVRHTKLQIIMYIVAFTVAVAQLTVFGYTGSVYLVIALGLGLAWLWLGAKGFHTADTNQWARKMFLFSLIVITVLCAAISVDASL